MNQVMLAAMEGYNFFFLCIDFFAVNFIEVLMHDSLLLMFDLVGYVAFFYVCVCTCVTCHEANHAGSTQGAIII